ncbi:MAG: hypothetical protein ABSF82_02280 [Candidatus Bathyarchaeia archaeon]
MEKETSGVKLETGIPQPGFKATSRKAGWTSPDQPYWLVLMCEHCDLRFHFQLGDLP